MTNAQAEQIVEYVNVDVEAGIIIQSLMFRHREKQADLAPVVGVSQSTLSKKLRGSVSFSLAELYRIARHYDVVTGDLLPRLDSNQQPCGYESTQVRTGVGDPVWAWMFDLYVVDTADSFANWSSWCDMQTRRKLDHRQPVRLDWWASPAGAQ